MTIQRELYKCDSRSSAPSGSRAVPSEILLPPIGPARRPSRVVAPRSTPRSRGGGGMGSTGVQAERPRPEVAPSIVQRPVGQLGIVGRFSRRQARLLTLQCRSRRHGQHRRARGGPTSGGSAANSPTLRWRITVAALERLLRNCATGRCAIGARREGWAFKAADAVIDRKPTDAPLRAFGGNHSPNDQCRNTNHSGKSRPRRQPRHAAASCRASSSTSVSWPARSRSMFAGWTKPSSSVSGVFNH